MNNLFRTSLLVLTTTAGATAGAQQAAFDPAGPLTPDSLVSIVMRQNPGLDSMRAAADVARLEIAPAGALPDPKLSGAVAPDTLGGLDTPSGTRRANVRFELSQEIPWPGTFGLRSRAARNEALAENEGIELMKLELAAAARSAYAEWVYVHRALKVNQESLALVAELKRIAETRYAAGLTSQQDALQADVELQHIHHQAIVLKRLQRAVRSKINRLLNRAPRASLGPPSGRPEAGPIPDYAALRRIALNGHPELRMIEQRIAAGQDRQALARKDAYPDFKVFSGYNSFLDAQPKRWSIGVGLSLPLDRSKYRDRISQAGANIQKLEYEMADRRAALLNELEQAHAMAEEAAHEIALYEGALIPRTRESLSAARAEYGSGSGSFLDVLLAEQVLLKAELELERSRADYDIAIAQLQRWSGSPLPEPTQSLRNSE